MFWLYKDGCISPFSTPAQKRYSESFFFPRNKVVAAPPQAPLMRN